MTGRSRSTWATRRRRARRTTAIGNAAKATINNQGTLYSTGRKRVAVAPGMTEIAWSATPSSPVAQIRYAIDAPIPNDAAEAAIKPALAPAQR